MHHLNLQWVAVQMAPCSLLSNFLSISGAAKFLSWCQTQECFHSLMLENQGSTLLSLCWWWNFLRTFNFLSVAVFIRNTFLNKQKGPEPSLRRVLLGLCAHCREVARPQEEALPKLPCVLRSHLPCIQWALQCYTIWSSLVGWLSSLL